MTTETLGDAFPKQQARCREMLKAANEIGAPGAFLAMQLEATLKEADQAAIAGDLPRMIIVFEEMKGFKE